MKEIERIPVRGHWSSAYQSSVERWPAPQYAPWAGERARAGAENRTGGAREALYLGVIILLAVGVVMMAYRFLWAGSTQQTDDGRVGIVLDPGERSLVLQEMRAFAFGLQGDADVLALGNMTDVAKASRAVGAAIRGSAPAAMTGKLPFEFKMLALETHAAFDTIAMDANSFALPERTLAQFAEVLEKCDACHQRYRIVAASAP